MILRPILALSPLVLLASCISGREPEPIPPRAPARPFAEVWAEHADEHAPAEADGASGGQATLADPVPPLAPTGYEVAHTVESAGGTFLVAWTTDPDPIPDNEPFEMVVSVLDARTGKILDDVELEVDAGMPQHGHGMNRQPRIERAGESRTFRVSGMLFHMIGEWQVYFDVTRGALTERAQVGVTLE
jgi:hypothetical protein